MDLVYPPHELRLFLDTGFDWSFCELEDEAKPQGDRVSVCHLAAYPTPVVSLLFFQMRLCF